MPIQVYRIAIVGPRSSGKSAFIKKHNAEDRNPVMMYTTNGDIFHLELQEISISKELQYTIEKKRTDAVIIMTTSISKDISIWLKAIHNDIPMIVTCNSDEMIYKRFQEEMDAYYIPNCNIDIKTEYNMNAPFLYLLKKLTNNNDLDLIDNRQKKKEQLISMIESALNELKKLQ